MIFSSVVTVAIAVLGFCSLGCGVAVLCRWLGERELGGPGARVSGVAVDRVRARLQGDRQRLLDEPETAWRARGMRLAAEAEAFLADTAS